MNRVILITGAASGIGRATALKLAGPGNGLLLHTRKNRAGLNQVAAQAAGQGASVDTALGDLETASTAPALVGAAVERFGRLDVVIANAGAALKQPVGGFELAQLEAAWRAGVAGFLGLAQAAIAHLRKAENPRIIALSSFVAHHYRAELGAFPATASVKAAIEALVRSLAVQLAPHAITVNAVAPGFTKKDPGAHSAMSVEQWQAIERQIPLGRRAEPAEIAGLIAWLAGPESAYMTGQVLRIDGGL